MDSFCSGYEMMIWCLLIIIVLLLWFIVIMRYYHKRRIVRLQGYIDDLKYNQLMLSRRISNLVDILRSKE